MRECVLEISTEVFRLLQKRAPGYVSWVEEKPGRTQKILVAEDVYAEFIDRAITHRQTLDQVVREACARTQSQVLGGGHGGKTRPVKNAN